METHYIGGSGRYCLCARGCWLGVSHSQWSHRGTSPLRLSLREEPVGSRQRDAWADRVEHYADLVRRAPDGAIRLVVPYGEHDASVVVDGHPDGPPDAARGRVGVVAARRPLDLVPWLSW